MPWRFTKYTGSPTKEKEAFIKANKIYVCVGAAEDKLVYY